MAFAVIAEFPLGTYKGHSGHGGVEYLPSVARLHAALLCAAGSGPRADLVGDHLVPNPTDMMTLEWLEEYPPDGIAVPQHHYNLPSGIAYRQMGLVRSKQVKVGGSQVQQREWRPAGRLGPSSVALNGPVAWVWEKPPPDEVIGSLAALCSDVSHLGMSETPVRLRVGECEPTHCMNPEADLFVESGLDVEVPSDGRTDELIALERMVRGATPSVANDRVPANEKDLSAPPSREKVKVARYEPVNSEDFFTPWSTVFLVRLNRSIDPEWRVRWAVSAHRALVALVANDVPSILSGAYPPNAIRPANRVAIHFLESETLAGGRMEDSAMLVLIPAGAAQSDVYAVAQALSRLRLLRGPGGQVAQRLERPELLDASAFWPPVAMGCKRSWLTLPAAVPDGRPPVHKGWSMADAVALSVGLVWRDHLIDSAGAENKRVALAKEAQRRGVSVDGLSMVPDGDLSRFVHRVNPGALIRPYRALINLGTLAGAQSLVAIGQSRHLGGGLLRPIDVPFGQEEARS